MILVISGAHHIAFHIKIARRLIKYLSQGCKKVVIIHLILRIGVFILAIDDVCLAVSL